MASSISDSVPGTPPTPRPAETRPAETSQTAPASASRDGITRRDTVAANQESVTRADAPPPPPADSRRGQAVDIRV
jgi:hypothetical protein